MCHEANCMFFNVIADAINCHNEQIRQKAIEEYEDASQTVAETVTETVTETIIETTNEDVSEDESEDE